MSVKPLFFLVFLALLTGTQGLAAGAPEIIGVRIGEEENRTRFVLDLSQTIEAKVFALTNPDRLVIDLPSVNWKLPSESARSGAGIVKGFRFGRFDGQTTRIVLDLTGAANVVQMFELPPNSGYQHRLVIDLAAKDPIADVVAAASGGASADAAAEDGVPLPLRKPKRMTLTVVIDPGHGGVDPGAIGIDGAKEKDVVLATALELRDQLKKKGYRVLMTRDSDQFLKLRTRVAIARDAKADLFVSLHADSNTKSELKGASVYTLSDNASDEEAAALASKENRADEVAGIRLENENEEVSSILIELSMRETMNQSARFARTLLPHMDSEAPLLRNTHRFAGFRVLKAPDVPSVLVELGLLSNRDDEKRLTDPDAQERMAKAIARAIDGYFQLDHRAALP